jgi:methyl-accepting chemotaxis protein
MDGGGLQLSSIPAVIAVRRRSVRWRADRPYSRASPGTEKTMAKKKMGLGVRLPLAFAFNLLLMFGAAIAGLWGLQAALATFDSVSKISVEQERSVRDMEVGFKEQVQEWKNVLLRGKDPALMEKYWKAFESREKQVANLAQGLLATLTQPEARQLVEQFAAAHQRMGEGYRKGLDAFKAADLQHEVGDKAVRGMDREPAKLLDEAAQRIKEAGNAMVVGASAAGKRASLFSLVGMLIVVMIGVAVALLASRKILAMLGGEPEDAAAAARAVAQGDLTTALQVKPGDQTSLMAALADMQQQLAGIVSTVSGAASSVASASEQIAQGNTALAARTEEQAASLEETAASMEELTSTVKQSADSAHQANTLAQSATDVATRGGVVVGRVVDTMKGIDESSKRIGDIINVIDGIAFQTNILALNAAVEAARAGDQGRGFAVVAGEVRSLAQRSAQAAKEIKGLITASMERVEQGSELVEEAGRTATETVQAIKRLSDLVSEITAASQEQNAGIDQIANAVSQMDLVTQQNAALVEESAAAAESLRDQAARLVHTVAVFTIADNKAAVPSAERRGPNRAKNVARLPARPGPAAPAATQRHTGTHG